MEAVGWRLWTIFCCFRGRRRGPWWRRRKIESLKESLTWKAQGPCQTTEASQATRKESKESVFSFFSLLSHVPTLIFNRRATCGGGIRTRSGERTTYKIYSHTLVVYWLFVICLPPPPSFYWENDLVTYGTQTVSQTLDCRSLRPIFPSIPSIIPAQMVSQAHLSHPYFSQLAKIRMLVS